MGKFRYHIENANLPNEDVDSPDGWKNDESVFPRSPKYNGIFRKFSANELVFKGTGADFLRRINSQLAFESAADFLVYEVDYETYTEFLRFRGSFNFVDYKAFDGNEGRNVKIIVIDSSFWNTIKNGEKIRPQLSRLEALNGFQISGFTNEETWIKLPSIPEILVGTLEADSSQSILGNHSSPLILLSSNDDNVITVANTGVTDGQAGSFYISSGVNSIKISVGYETDIDFGSDKPVVELKLKRYNSSDVLQEEEILATLPGELNTIKTLYFSGDRTFTPNDGDYFLLTVESNNIFEDFDTVTPYLALVTTEANVDELPDFNISGMLIHEAWSRNLQILTGTDKPLYSELLGRLNSEPRSYSADGDLSKILITSGERIRGFSRDESPITLSHDEIFTAVNALKPICALIEVIDGVDTLRVEEIKYAFDDRIILTIDNASNIEESYISERIFNKISVGYSKALYEERNGLNEFNQKSEFSTPITVVNEEYNVVSPIRADNNAIQNARAKPKSSFPTEDTRYDSDNFFITLVTGTTLLLNGNFESWTDDNTPDDWITTGTVLRKNLLGSNRCYYESGILGQASVKQSVVVSSIIQIDFKLSYENIGATDINALFTMKLTNGGQTFYLKADGTWLETTTQQLNYFVTNFPPTAESSLQSFQTYSLLTENIPTTGTIELWIPATVGFLVDDIYFGESQYLAKTNEGFDVIENTPFGENSFNLDITPARNLREHGPILRAGLENRLSQFVKFNTSEKNSTTITKKTTESVAIAENEDVLVNDLATPFFKPNAIDFNLIVDKSVVDVLNETFTNETKPNYLGIVRFRQSTTEDYRYVWLLDLNTGGESKLGKVLGLEVNTDYITPLIQIKYGWLYNWYVISDIRKLTSSDNWTIPTDTKLKALADYLGAGGDYINNSVGGKLKETGFIYWLSPNTGATNEFSFNGRGAGVRTSNGAFSSMLITGRIWSSTSIGNNSWLFVLSNDTDKFLRTAFPKKYGQSIRLIKDATGIADGVTGSYTGNDGTNYRTIVINEIEWLADNLAETKYRNGDWITGYDGGTYTPISDVNWAAKTTEAMCAYNDKESNVLI